MPPKPRRLLLFPILALLLALALGSAADTRRVALAQDALEVPAPPEDDPAEPLVFAPRTLTAQLTLDWFASDPGGRNRHLVQGLFDVKIQLTQLFALSFNVTLYGLKTRVRVDDFSKIIASVRPSNGRGR